MEIKTFPCDGLVLIKPRVFEDHRGFFMETYNQQQFEKAGLNYQFVQDNHSKSQAGTLRGLHYQVNQPQCKLVRAIVGAVFDVAVDLRQGSPTYGRWWGEILSAENKHQLLVPEGFAHGFQVLSPTAEIVYKCNAFYSPEDERGLLWCDPELGIQWPGDLTPILSEKDRTNPPLAKLDQGEIRVRDTHHEG